MKKLLSCLLAVAMMLSIVPVFSSAATTVAATVTAQKVNNTIVVTVTLPAVSKLYWCVVSVQFDPNIVSIPDEDGGYPAARDDGSYYFDGTHVGGYQYETENIAIEAYTNTKDDGVTTTAAKPFASFVFTIKDASVVATDFKVRLEQYKDASTEVVKGSGYTIASPVVAVNPPAAPTGVTAASASYTSTKISWKAVSGATAYVVYYSTSKSGTYTRATTSSTTALSFTHTGLTTGKTYYYKIKAYKTVTVSVNGTNKNVYSSYSSVVSAAPVPAAPTSVTAASASYNSVKVSWKAVSGATGYVLYYATSKTGTYSRVGTTTSTTLTHKSLSTGKTYYYKVKAYKTVSGTNIYGAASAIVSAKPVPSVPGSFAAAKASGTSIKLTWNSVSGATGYQVYRATSSTGTYTLLKTTTSLSFTNTGLTKGKTYYYKVRAYKTVNDTKICGSFTSVKSVKL